MVKNQKSNAGIQDDIFQQLETPAENCLYHDNADLDIELELRGALSQALKLARRMGIGRERVVDEMNRLLPELSKGKKITLRKINAWMATSKEDHEFPARFIPAFCAATQCDLPLRVMANAINFDLSDQRERLALELGQVEIQRAALVRKTKQLKIQLGE